MGILRHSLNPAAGGAGRLHGAVQPVRTMRCSRLQEPFGGQKDAAQKRQQPNRWYHNSSLIPPANNQKYKPKILDRGLPAVYIEFMVSYS
jgi:hypothetical protein